MINYKTSESVSIGHPDKMADYISDSIVDAYLAQDRDSHVGVETLLKGNTVVLAGEIKSSAKVDDEAVVREAVKHLNYDGRGFGFDSSCKIINLISQQSPDIALGVDKGGAGDQGIMYGYATNETKDYMPLEIDIANKLIQKEQGFIAQNPLYGADAKCQVTVKYDDNTPVNISTIIFSQLHSDKISEEQVSRDIIKYVIDPILQDCKLYENTKLLINPTGKFTIGGPVADAGVTGRKLVVDAYGGGIPIGGGAYCSKDPSKVDRSAAYMARCVAKNIVSMKMADKCLIGVSYAIGVKEPISISVDCFGTSYVLMKEIKQFVKSFSFVPDDIINYLHLKNIKYAPTNITKPYGNDLYPWEMI